MSKALTPTTKKKNNIQAITPEQTLGGRVVMPAVSADEAYEAWKAYQELKNKIIDPKTDIQVIRNQEFKKKSYWRKVATFFNLSIETRDEWKEMLGRTLVWHFTVRATAPNGRFVEGVGSCDVYEKATLRDGTYQLYNSRKGKWEEAEPNSPHNTRSTAYTRAYNRAVSDLVGGGELSAEEISVLHQQHFEESESTRRSVRPTQAESSVNAHADSTKPAEQRTEESVWPAHDVREVAQFKCEKCDETIPLNAMKRSQDRYDNHTFCFKHQLEYKRAQIRKQIEAKESAKSGKQPIAA